MTGRPLMHVHASTAPRPRNQRKAWSAKDDSYILIHLARPFRYSYRQIGEDLDRTAEAVRSRYKALQLIAIKGAVGRYTHVEQDKAVLIAELAAHIVSRNDMTPAKLDSILDRVRRLRAMPDRYWSDRASRPLEEWFREVAA